MVRSSAGNHLHSRRQADALPPRREDRTGEIFFAHQPQHARQLSLGFQRNWRQSQPGRAAAPIWPLCDARKSNAWILLGWRFILPARGFHGRYEDNRWKPLPENAYPDMKNMHNPLLAGEAVVSFQPEVTIETDMKSGIYYIPYNATGVSGRRGAVLRRLRQKPLAADELYGSLCSLAQPVAEQRV